MSDEDESKQDDPPAPKLDDKRWVLKHVLVPVLLACVPIYGAWTLAKIEAKAEAKTACAVESEAHKLVFKALIEQLRKEATKPVAQPTPTWTDEPPMMPEPEPTPEPKPEPVQPAALPQPKPLDPIELERALRERLMYRVPNASQQQTAGSAQEIMLTLDAADLPPEMKGKVRALVTEAAAARE